MIETDRLSDLLPWPALIDSLDTIFTKSYCCPIRHHHDISVPGNDNATLLLMPAWVEGEYLGVKQVNVFPGNAHQGKPGLSSHYLLSSATTGELLARLDGNIITGRRTAAAAALAARYLSRKNSRRLLMVGAGRVAHQVVPAMLSVRDIEHIDIWNLDYEQGAAFAKELNAQGISAHAIEPNRLHEAAANADIISCATLSTSPLLCGDWITPGTHVDLIGSFTPHMREADDTLMAKAHVFVDFKEAALQETGDLIDPVKNGTLREADILGDFLDFSRGLHRGRTALSDDDHAITVFKAVGSSIEDLAAAILAYKQLTA
ncbi:ornithine cyclodeaminase family protein [Halomonas piscis]|uniref:ornithine cyclodeaminase family protein n=1 Tax=Halomonas piscis TaxID=3031727 RepID=UPI00289ED508|nr:ornithine cyclodeaminase family protein [Halomonas piscis]